MPTNKRLFEVDLQAMASVRIRQMVMAETEEEAGRVAREQAARCSDNAWDIRSVDTTDIEVVDVVPG